MVPVVFTQSLLMAMPSHYMGRWRALFNGYFTVNGDKYRDCKIGYADIYED